MHHNAASLTNPSSYRGSRKPIQLPLSMNGSDIVGASATLNLADRPLTMRLFALFLEKRHAGVARGEMLKSIYFYSDGQQRSERFRVTQEHNLVKLMSRARRLACQHLTPGSSDHLSWFYFDRESKRWFLRIEDVPGS